MHQKKKKIIAILKREKTEKVRKNTTHARMIC